MKHYFAGISLVLALTSNVAFADLYNCFAVIRQKQDKPIATDTIPMRLSQIEPAQSAQLGKDWQINDTSLRFSRMGVVGVELYNRKRGTRLSAVGLSGQPRLNAEYEGNGDFFHLNCIREGAE